MPNLIAFMAALALQAGAPAQVAVLSECDASSDIVAQVPKDAAIDVHYSIAGAPTCYLVTLIVQGKTVRGYVVDRGADAVVAFDKSRVESEQTAFKAPLPVAVIAAPAMPLEPAKTTAVEVKAEEKKPLPKPKKMEM